MAPPYILYAFSGRRREGAETCAHRLDRMLASLADVHTALSTWKISSEPWGSSAQYRATPLTIPELTAIIEQRQFMTDIPGVAMPQLGYRLRLLNGRGDDHRVWMSAQMGAYTERQEEPNSVFAEFRHPVSGNSDLLNADILMRTLVAVSLPWEANWGVVMPWGYSGRYATPLKRPWAGWITYLCPRHAQRISPPQSIISRPAPDGGLLLIATEEPFDRENQAHTSSADAIEAALRPVQT
ncbi:MAG: Imm52 family immunity protein [Terriglobales bacterium]